MIPISDDIAIQVRGLGKKYRIGGPQEQYHTFRDAIVNSVKAPFSRLTQPGTVQSQNEFWALKDVSFDVHQGEVIGIIGRNGAGKSTLLKILSQITTPTEGEVDIFGRVGSLLEVGTGFHPELTGRENIFLSGSILGMRKCEIEDKFDEIVKFSEIEMFIDTPVKRYSSGMYVRLAFAVAAHMETEILLVDEVLAVGDATFQKKCIQKMGEVTQQGRTILFVSHNMPVVQNLCENGLLLSNGKINYCGDIDEVIHEYMELYQLNHEIEISTRNDRKGNQILKFYKIGLFDDKGREINKIINGLNVYFRLYYHSEKIYKNASVFVSFNIRNMNGYLITNINSKDAGPSFMNINNNGYFECCWSKFNLRAGIYDCNLFCSINSEISDWIQSAFSIEVEDGDFYGTGSLTGAQGDILIVNNWKSVDGII